MQPNSPRASPVRFGVFEVDVEAGELRKNGLKVPLQEQPFRVLALLLEKPGQLVTREELQQKLWPSDTFVEFDRGLNTAINKVRESLGDSAAGPRFVETLPRRGYRFLASVDGLTERPAAAARPTPFGRSVWLSVSVGLLAGLIAGAAVWRQFGTSATKIDLPLRKLAITPKGLITRQTADPNTKQQSISPDGRYIVYVAESPSANKHLLSVYELESGASRELAGTEGAYWPFWSPDSDSVGFAAGGNIKKVRVQGGPVITVTATPLPEYACAGSWSPDGTEISFSDGGHLYVVPSVGGIARESLLPQPHRSVIMPRFAPTISGRDMFFVLSSAGGGPTELRVLDAAARQRTLMPPDAGAILAYAWPVWSPSGHLIYQRKLTDNLSNIWAVPFSLAKLSIEGDPFPIASSAISPSVSRDGTFVYRSLAAPAQKRLVWVDRNGRRLAEIGEPQIDMYLPTISRDGRYVAVEGIESTGTDVWIHETARATKIRLTLDPARDSRPVWSPDGKQIAFWSNQNGGIAAYIQTIDGSGKTERLSPVASEDVPENTPTDWSIDGNYLLFDGGGCLRRGPNGNWEKLDSHFKGQAGTLSPNGRFVAFVAEAFGRWEVYVQAFPESDHRWQVSSGGGGQPRWSQDGKELFYVKEDALFSVPVSTRPPNFSFGTQKRLFSSAALDWEYPSPTFDTSSDGRRFILIEPAGPTPQPAIWVVQNWFSEFRHRKSGRR